MIVVAGISYRTAPLAVREKLAFPKDSLLDALNRLKSETGLREAMILSTCNRVEIYGEGDAADMDAVLCFLARGDANQAEFARHLYRHEGEAAVRHALRVATSLDSMVLGETQILGQVKDAYRRAEQAGSLGPFLIELRNRSVTAARRARGETRIGENAVSVSHVAVELARKVFGGLDGRSVLLVGAGKMSELAARQLVKRGARATVLGGRSFERAAELAAALGGRAQPLERLRDELATADIVISSTGAPGFVIGRPDLVAARGGRRRPLFLIDIAVPRDVDPAVRDLEGVFLYDLDDLKSVADANLRRRSREVEDVDAIVEEEVEEQMAWQRSREAVPLVVELRRRGDAIRQAEVQRALRRLGTFTPEQAAAFEAVAEAIVNKLLHPPTVNLKTLAREGRPEGVAVARQVLGLQGGFDASPAVP